MTVKASQKGIRIEVFSTEFIAKREDAGGFGNGPDAAGTEGDVLECAPTFFEFGRGSFVPRLQQTAGKGGVRVSLSSS
ncbi:hypothetical protein ACFV16_35675 [Streptomyces massasporeus]|uniref:hypothetical protein n=1 Tax=Streptomyces massasporeus TaxID=67324 RepID=UPI003694A0DC